MEVKAKLSNLRVSPKKARQVADLIRGKKIAQAQATLSFTINKTARSVLKLLNSALASAKNANLSESDLFISKITVDEGPKLKRWHPMSRGRAYPIIKRSSHIFLALNDGKNQEAPKEKASPEPASIKEKKAKKPARKKVRKPKAKK